MRRARQARVFRKQSRLRGMGLRRLAPRFRATYNRNHRTGGFLGQELKFYDTKLTSGTLTASNDASGGEHDPSATIVLNSVTQGDGEQQRDGRKMTMKSIYLQGTIATSPQASVSSADNGTAIFIAIVLDTQTNGATVVSEQVYVNKGGTAASATLVMRNLEFSSRYRVLKSMRMILDNPAIANDTGATGGLVQQGQIRLWSMWVNLKDLGVTFNGTTETVANITDNSLHLIAYTNNVALAPAITYNARLRFMG